MLAAQSDFKFLATIFVFLRPFGVVFSVRLVSGIDMHHRHELAYFKISLSLTIRLISATNVSLTHTMDVRDAI